MLPKYICYSCLQDIKEREKFIEVDGKIYHEGCAIETAKTSTYYHKFYSPGPSKTTFVCKYCKHCNDVILIDDDDNHPEPRKKEKISEINYKFNEPSQLEEIKQYVDSTYQKHYVEKDQKQTLESIIEDGYGEGFIIGNLKKLIGRFGKKAGKNREDLLKIAHYTILALNFYKEKRNGN